MKIAVACDHGGLRLKNVLIDEMKKQGYEAAAIIAHHPSGLGLTICDYLKLAEELCFF